MRIIFAQGNPGPDYQRTRHNVGWQFLEAFATHHAATFVTKAKFHAAIAECAIDGEKVLLVRPTTFYNETGLAARALTDFYKLTPSDFLIIHDDLALPIGTIRTRIGGSSAGNNGIKSLNAHLGEGTARLRIGIFDATVPRAALSSVLGTFTADEAKLLDDLTPKIFNIFNDFITGQFTTTTHR